MTAGVASIPLQRALARVLDRRDLDQAEMAEVTGEIMDGRATPAQIGGFLVALRAKGETIGELVGAALAMRTRATPLVCPDPERGIDTCGTGGDGAGTINVSTIAAILIAASGGVVAKHGNRAQSSKCGSADVLEALGVAVDAEPAIVERCMAVAGIGFALAPRFHAATRHAMGPRRELGTRTIFNLLGPLTNPANVRHQIVGVYARQWCEPVAAALGALGLRRAAVVHGDGAAGSLSGIDEISVSGSTDVWLSHGDGLRHMVLTPSAFELDPVDPAGLAGGDAEHNAAVLRDVIAGRETGRGERLEAALHAAAMTAALGLELLERDVDVARLPAQYVRAAAAATNGTAERVLVQWREASRQ